GMQTLLQLFPPEIESKKVIKSSWTLPQVQITDTPRFAWRGLMLDIARHFFNKDEIKHFIDDMAKYKFNILHLHLTDDEGWRIEIKSLPKLTEIGAWRPDRIGTFTFFTHPKQEDPDTYGGFLTQEDVKEIVAYAGKHYINVMPEIDVPGHSLAAIAAYGNLASVPGNYRPCSGDTVMVWPKGGDFYAVYDNSLCAGKPEVYHFLDKVFTEVAALFPFEYIHVGGDENAKNFWEKSEEIKELMKRENIPNIRMVQGYFTHRLEKIIKSKGKKMIGWDEISEGELDSNTAIMGWRASKGGIDAANKQHEVVFASSKYAYLSYMQGDPAIEPPVHSTRLLKTTYETEPLPDGMDSRYLKGIEACLWTEQIYNYKHLQYMLWPRAFAMAELAWTPANRKNWPEFISRVEKHFVRYNYSETKYSPALYDPLLKVEMGKDNILKLTMETQISGLRLYYSFDNSFPDNFYPEYTGAINVPKDASMFRVISYRNDKPVGRMISATIADLKKRIE
ncbi:MAG: beta-N-acetylhexosaminidase, partial [Ginsengibacter sp.]